VEYSNLVPEMETFANQAFRDDSAGLKRFKSVVKLIVPTQRSRWSACHHSTAGVHSLLVARGIFPADRLYDPQGGSALRLLNQVQDAFVCFDWMLLDKI
jgi:hypothetical protein